MNKLRQAFWREHIVLFFFWFIATAYNLDKAYHIDDTAHLEIARWIEKNPSAPMTGLVNWSDNAQPIHRLNQPPLYFYLLAGWGHIFGYNEIAMHALQSLFTIVAIYFFFKTTKIHVPRFKLILSAFLILGPAFFVGQNLMVDIPILSCWIAFYYLLLIPETRSEHWRYILAAIIASAAILMKYSSLPLIPILIFHILLREKYRYLYTALIPFIFVFGWSSFNFLEYGSIHILNRPTQPLSLSRLLTNTSSWIATLGAIAPFSVFFMPESLWSFKSRLTSVRWLAFLSILFVATAPCIYFVYERIHSEFNSIGSYIKYLLPGLFIINGTYLVLLILYTAGRIFKKPCIIDKNEFNFLASLRNKLRSRLNDFVLFYWLISGAAFIIFFAPFMATRHVLLSIPALLLILGATIQTQRLYKMGLYVSLIATFFLTANLALSDWQFANYYREKASEIVTSLPPKSVIWFTGHWGWQWYAKQSGMKQLEGLTPEASPGDYVIYPKYIHQQRINPKLILEKVKVIPAPPLRLTYFSTANGARFYSSMSEPWSISRKPFGDIVIYRVEKNLLLND